MEADQESGRKNPQMGNAFENHLEVQNPAENQNAIFGERSERDRGFETHLKVYAGWWDAFSFHVVPCLLLHGVT